MKTYKPSSLRTKEHKPVPIMYGIGFLVSEDAVDDWSLVAGPFPEIETALEKIGSEGEHIVRLSDNPKLDKALWAWDDQNDEWIEL